MLAMFWYTFLYQPVFNLLIWLYTGWAGGNLGWAVVILTVLLRLVLLPFTLVTERDHIRDEALSKDFERLNKAFVNDPVMKKQEIRKVLRRRRMRPWAKRVVLLVPALVWVLLYQVFLQGISGEKLLRTLYRGVDFPGAINAVFFGFELGHRHDLLWSGIVGLYLFLDIYLGFRRRGHGVTRSDLYYVLLFPLAVMGALWWLPMVKSLFILTSMLFSDIIYQLSRFMFKPASLASGPASPVAQQGGPRTTKTGAAAGHH
ncbi:MAG: YidC/Oxa1 family membrane protein insertase [Candidatus Magasanikbacteria bacterium]|nr:YidC/Oxa1 family membrane protein insertase [Candidatus Magasanikbacteria bacterium]